MPAQPGNSPNRLDPNLPISSQPARSVPSPNASSASNPSPGVRQLQDIPRDELHALAQELGLEPEGYPTAAGLVAAVHQRRQLIASMDREAMLDVVRWGRRPVPASATREQLAMEIVRIRSMRFEGLSHPGLLVLARLRGLSLGALAAAGGPSDAVPGAAPVPDVPTLVKALKKQEGFFARLSRKRRSWLGSVVSNLLGDGASAAAGEDYRFVPPEQESADRASPAGASPGSIKQDIEESGLFGGIASRVKKTADAYLNQKLDDIEARIDRKLDEIDRRLGEWRDKEIANRIRILKITLWASVIVGVVSLLYSYIKVYVIAR